MLPESEDLHSRAVLSTRGSADQQAAAYRSHTEWQQRSGRKTLFHILKLQLKRLKLFLFCVFKKKPHTKMQWLQRGSRWLKGWEALRPSAPAQPSCCLESQLHPQSLKRTESNLRSLKREKATRLSCWLTPCIVSFTCKKEKGITSRCARKMYLSAFSLIEGLRGLILATVSGSLSARSVLQTVTPF